MPAVKSFYLHACIFSILAASELTTWAVDALANDGSNGDPGLVICILNPIFARDDKGDVPGSVSVLTSARWAGATLLAIEHINSKNCSTLGAECGRISDTLDFFSGKPLTPLLYDLQTHGPQMAPIAALDCLKSGGKFMLGGVTSQQSNIVAQLATIEDQLLISSAATSARVLPDSETYQNFARTTLSIEPYIKALVSFIKHVGWQQAAALHMGDASGLGVSQMFAKLMLEQGLQSITSSLGRSISSASTELAIRSVADSGMKVVVVACFHHDVQQILQTASQILSNYREFTWLIIHDGGEEVASGSEESGKETHASSTDIFEGVICVKERIRTQSSENLKGLLKDSKERLAAQMIALTGGNDLGLRSNISSAVIADLERTMDSDGELDIFTLASYDAAWALVASIGASMSANPGEVLSGSAVVQQIRSGKALQFQGLSSWAGFDSRGDAHEAGIELQITSFARYNGAANEPVERTIGTWTLNGGVSIDDTVPIIWADGLSHQIPDDGSSVANQSPQVTVVLIATGIVLILMLATLVICLLRNLHLSNQVTELLDKQVNSLDVAHQSPLQKVLDFLQRYQSSMSFWKRPSREEARALHMTLIMNPDHLNNPDLENCRFSASEVTKQWLHESLFSESNASKLYAKRMQKRARRVSSLHKFSVSAAESMAPLALAKVQTMEVPANVVCEICNNMMLDMVTDNSLLRTTASPLAIVAKAAAMHLQMVDEEKVVLDNDFILPFVNFACEVEDGYTSEGYHCKLHAADVTNRLMTILACTEIDRSFDVGLAALIAACVHDYKHPQRNNLFLIETDHHMATDFNHQAPAENYAVKEGLSLMDQPGFNFLADARVRSRIGGGQGVKALKRRVIQMVMATEMAKHFDIVGKFDSQVASSRILLKKKGKDKWEAMTDEQKALTLQMAIKVADLGHCALPLSQHTIWIDRLESEFFDQGDDELANGLPISLMMDRRGQGRVSHADTQVGFFHVFVLPMLTSWTNVFPECKNLLDEAVRNFIHWEMQTPKALSLGRKSETTPSSSLQKIVQKVQSARNMNILHSSSPAVNLPSEVDVESCKESPTSELLASKRSTA